MWWLHLQIDFSLTVIRRRYDHLTTYDEKIDVHFSSSPVVMASVKLQIFVSQLMYQHREHQTGTDAWFVFSFFRLDNCRPSAVPAIRAVQQRLKTVSSLIVVCPLLLNQPLHQRCNDVIVKWWDDISSCVKVAPKSNRIRCCFVHWMQSNQNWILVVTTTFKKALWTFCRLCLR